MRISVLLARALRRLVTCVTVLTVVAFAPASAAQAPSLSEMDHKTWTARDGAPQGVKAMAQARDGVLWIGGVAGLSSFDGRTFTVFRPGPGSPPLPAGPVESVLAAKDGSIWVGFREGGAARIVGDRVTSFPTIEGIEVRGVQFIQQASDGDIWALNRQQDLIRFGRDGRWRVEASPRGDKGGRIRRFFIDSSDAIWVAQGGRLYRRPAGQARYVPTEASADWMFGAVEMPDRTLWLSDVITDHPGGPTGRTQHIGVSGEVLGRLPDTDNAVEAIITPDGSMIVSAWGVGLVRYPATALARAGVAGARTGREVFDQAGGLSSNSLRALLMDKDGNLWVGGQRGLDRFRQARLNPFKTDANEPFLCADPAGDVWVYVSGEKNRLFRVADGISRPMPQSGQISTMQCGPDGRIWFAATTGVWEMRGDRARPLPPIPGMVPFSIHQVVATPGGQVFAMMSGGPELGGLWRLTGAKWAHLTEGLPPAKTPSTSYADAQDRLWLAYRDELVTLPLRGGRPSTLSSRELGTIYAFLETPDGLFVGGLNGLAVVRDGRLQMLNVVGQTPVQGIAGLVAASDGDLWLNALAGVFRIRQADLRTAVRNPKAPLKADRFVEGEFVGPVNLWSGKPSAGRDAQGRLWFATLNGVFHLDPNRLTSGIQPPILSIRSVAADKTPIRPGGDVAAGPRTLEIRYLGVNLTTPDDVVYRYRLEGLDEAWQDAGHRTEAVYARLRPGRYTFRVAASNGDGDWSSTTAVSFRVLPHFYQTRWFLGLSLALGLLLMWLAVTLRLRVITREIQARAEERADERIRISRDLHDTLLQGVQGLLLTLHVATQKIAPQHEARVLLDRALATADRIILEGRNRVKDLRSGRVVDAELAPALEVVGQELQGQPPVDFEVRRLGLATPLLPQVADAVFHIAREAVTNAFRHAGANRITVELTYERDRFQLTCRDDGRGLAPGADNKTGHWGLKGMRERALELGGRLTAQSAPDGGVEVILVVPARRAFAREFDWRAPFRWRPDR